MSKLKMTPCIDPVTAKSVSRTGDRPGKTSGRTRLTAQKAPSDHGSNHRANDRSGREIRKPMDSRGDPYADVESVGDGHTAQPPLLWEEGEYRGGHRECDGSVRGRPAPEDPAAQEAEAKRMANIRAQTARRMNAARDHFIS